MHSAAGMLSCDGDGPSVLHVQERLRDHRASYIPITAWQGPCPPAAAWQGPDPSAQLGHYKGHICVASHTSQPPPGKWIRQGHPAQTPQKRLQG
eukprot:353161-Chlamydomonas_euryale.AAC.1